MPVEECRSRIRCCRVYKQLGVRAERSRAKRREEGKQRGDKEAIESRLPMSNADGIEGREPSRHLELLHRQAGLLERFWERET